MSKPAAQIFLQLLSALSLRNQYRIADLVSLVGARIPNQLNRQARENIRLCFGEESEQWQLRLERESIRHTCYAFFELAALWCWPISRILACIGELQLCDSFRDSTRGKIVIAPHLGSWELLNLWLAQQGELLSLYRHLRNNSLEQFVLESRSRNGARLVPTTTAGLRKLLSGLKSGHTLMLLPDQKPAAKKSSVAAEFFGLQAPTTTLVHSLCSRIDCDVFIGAAYRQRETAGFGIYLQPLDRASLGGDASSSASYMNRQIEKLARLYPEQYQWPYRRFYTFEYEQP